MDRIVPIFLAFVLTFFTGNGFLMTLQTPTQQARSSLFERSPLPPEPSGLPSSILPSRRNFVAAGIFPGVVMAFTPTKNLALDMEKFINSELTRDKNNCDPKIDKKCVEKLSKDEAMCKYGQSGPARGEACVRARESKSTVSIKSGLDPYGKVDRGDFVRCKAEYVLDGACIPFVSLFVAC